LFGKQSAPARPLLLFLLFHNSDLLPVDRPK
jgi:hypothetical protein